jgi:hypothetical protein
MDYFLTDKHFYSAYYENDRFGLLHYSAFNDKPGMKVFL